MVANRYLVTGPKIYSGDLKQGELELPDDFCFTLLIEYTVSSNETKEFGKGAKV